MNDSSTVLRVLHIVTNMERGGLETMIMNYYRHIDRDKVQFDFLVHRQTRAAYDDEIESMGGKIHRISRLVPWSKSYKKELDDFFVSHPEYSVIHVHQDCLSAVALKAAKKRGVKTRIAHSHISTQDKNIKYPIKLFYKRFIPKYATDLFACSELAGNWMFGGAPFSVLRNAIDTKSFVFSPEKREEKRRELGISDVSLVVGHVGRFMPQKNHKFIIETFAELLKLEPNSDLILIGDGDLRVNIEKQISMLGIEKRVHLIGVSDDVPSYLQAMDLFFLPSKYEGLGIVLIEAQTCGLPCVISDVVPDECIMCSDLIDKMSLEETSENWAKRLLKYKGAKRRSRLNEVCSAGYDMIENAKNLQEFYLEKR